MGLSDTEGAISIQLVIDVTMRIRNRKEKVLVCVPMKDYYLQNIIDHFWQDDSIDNALFMSFEFILGEYKLEHISIEEFNLLFNIIIMVKRLYDIPEFKK